MRADRHRLEPAAPIRVPPVRPPRAPAPAAASCSPGIRRPMSGIPFEWASLNAAQQAALDVRGCLAHQRAPQLSARRSQQRDQLGRGRPVSRARRRPRGHRRFESRLGGSAFLALYVDVDRPSVSHGGHGREQRLPGYVQFNAAEQTRLNVVYVGSNDGFLHGFEAGSFDANGNFVVDDAEMTARKCWPTCRDRRSRVPRSASAAGGCTDETTTSTVVQSIHGVTPAVGATPECVRNAARLREFTIRP